MGAGMMFVIVQSLEKPKVQPMLFVAPDNVSEDGIKRHLSSIGQDDNFRVWVLCADTPTVLGSDKEIADFVGGVD